MSAAEPSADLYARCVVDALPRDLEVYALGGPELARTRAIPVGDNRGLAAWGMSRWSGSAVSGAAAYRTVARWIDRLRIDTFMPFAYPGLHLPLCRFARGRGALVIYHLPPQVWAWGAWRIALVRRWVDQVVCFFDFEAVPYRRARIAVTVRDNPLAAVLKTCRRRDWTRRVGLMPGSRRPMVMRNLPVMLDIAGRLVARGDSGEVRAIVHDATLTTGVDLGGASLVDGARCDRHQAMIDCDLLLVSSGTASYEAWLMGIPQVFLHRTARADHWLLRRLVKTREYCLANIAAGRRAVPAMLSPDATALRRWALEQLAEKRSPAG